MTITLTGAPRTKKNSQRIIRRGRFSSILPSEAYMDYAEECAVQLLAQRATNVGISYPVNVACVYYMPTRRKVDLVNLLEATCDILKDNYVVMDDNLCSTHITADALDLLREQKPVTPTWRRGLAFCGKCGRQFGHGFKYCPDCGQAVMWDA